MKTPRSAINLDFKKFMTLPMMRTLRNQPGKIIFSAALLLVLALAGCGRTGNQAGAPPLAIDYTAMDLDHLEAGRDAAYQAASGLTNEDGAVLCAWAGVFTNLIAARDAVQETEKTLTDADILNPDTITNGSQRCVDAQFFDRRVIANTYRDALDRQEHALSTIEGSYVDELDKFQVSPDRRNKEWQAFAKVLNDQIHAQLHQQIESQRNICAAERKVAMQYNYATGPMQLYVELKLALMPVARPGYVIVQRPNAPMNPALKGEKEEFDEKLAELDKLKQAVVRLQQPAGNKAGL